MLKKIRLKKLLCYFDKQHPAWLGEYKTSEGQWLTITGVYDNKKDAKLALLQYVVNAVWEDTVEEKVFKNGS